MKQFRQIYFPNFVCIYMYLIYTCTCIHLTGGWVNKTTYIPHVQRTYPQESFHQGLCQLLQRVTYNPVRKPKHLELILLHKC